MKLLSGVLVDFTERWHFADCLNGQKQFEYTGIHCAGLTNLRLKQIFF
jgi:hypothetical protein